INANRSDNSGGGLLNEQNLTLNNSTVSANTAADFGGGAYNAGALHLFHVTLAGNLADNGAGGSRDGGGIYNGAAHTVALFNSLLGENQLGSAANDCGGAPLTSGNYNLIQAGLGCLSAAGSGDIAPSDILLGPLQGNGGPTPTRALLTGS